MRQLGELKRVDPELYVFIEEAFLERERRLSEQLDRAQARDL